MTDQHDLATALATHLCELDACTNPAPCPDHLTVAGTALKFLANEGRRQADAQAFVDQWAACPSCRTSGPAVGACEDRWHLDNLVGGPNGRFNAAVRELAGLFGARQGGKTTAARIVKEIYDAGEADGRRQATEGWERQWAVAHVDGGWVYPYGSEAEARAHCTVEWHQVVSRLVGPWEPAEQPEPVKLLSYHYGPTSTNPDPGAMWCNGCGGRVDVFDGHAVCGCGAQLCESPTDCGDDTCPYRPANGVEQPEDGAR